MESFILVIFVVGYLFIAFEHSVQINKAASALITGVLCWTVYILYSSDNHFVGEQLAEHLGDAAGILFFLLGAMTIVELIDAHDGFTIITSRITATNKRSLLWIISILTFFLSAVLDNLTTSIVMVSLLRKLITDRNDRMVFLGFVIIAANAGGAWSPIGDVTTTMLWIGGQVTSKNIIIKLFTPSLACLIVPLLIASFKMKGKLNPVNKASDNTGTTNFERNFIFWSGISILILVPAFKTATHLPPYMGILLGLGILWVITEITHKSKNDEEKSEYSVVHALRKADTPSVLFFLGILLAIGSLQATGQLGSLAQLLDEKIGDINQIVLSIGLLSSIVDNVPMVAGAIGMYDLQTYPSDHYFWEFLAYCAGTGGSALIIGSAAGVAVMGLEKIDFFWYLKNISLLALIGYFVGAFVYILQHQLFHI